MPSKQPSADDFYEEVVEEQKQPPHIWGGYSSHSPWMLVLWIGGGAALAFITSLLLLTLALALLFQFANWMFPNSDLAQTATQAVQGSKEWFQDKLHVTESKVNSLQAEINDLNQEINSLKSAAR